MTDEIYYIVVRPNYWGRSTDLGEAFANCGLKPSTPLDHFKWAIEDEFDVAKAAANWDEYAAEEHEDMASEKVPCVIFRVSPEYWTDWDISPIDGAVSLYAREEVPKEDRQRLYEESVQACWWQNGALTPREV